VTLRSRQKEEQHENNNNTNVTKTSTQKKRRATTITQEEEKKTYNTQDTCQKKKKIDMEEKELSLFNINFLGTLASNSASSFLANGCYFKNPNLAHDP